MPSRLSEKMKIHFSLFFSVNFLQSHSVGEEKSHEIVLITANGSSSVHSIHRLSEILQKYKLNQKIWNWNVQLTCLGCESAHWQLLLTSQEPSAWLDSFSCFCETWQHGHTLTAFTDSSLPLKMKRLAPAPCSAPTLFYLSSFLGHAHGTDNGDKRAAVPKIICLAQLIQLGIKVSRCEALWCAHACLFKPFIFQKVKLGSVGGARVRWKHGGEGERKTFSWIYNEYMHFYFFPPGIH